MAVLNSERFCDRAPAQVWASRYVVAWLVALRESGRLAEELIADAVYAQGVPAGQLSLHADRGTSMTSKSVSHLLADLGVLQSHSRPHQSNDNPFSEANFKTLKYFPAFPRRFAGLVSARSFVDGFFGHYNNHHRPSHGASPCTPPPTCTTAGPKTFGPGARSSSPPTRTCRDGSARPCRSPPA